MNTKTMACEIVNKINHAWQYKRKECSISQKEIINRIENYKSIHMISRVDKFDFRKKLDENLYICSQIADFVVIFNEIYAPITYVNKCRKNGISCNITHHLVFVYYPNLNDYRFFTYSVCN